MMKNILLIISLLLTGCSGELTNNRYIIKGKCIENYCLGNDIEIIRSNSDFSNLQDDTNKGVYAYMQNGDTIFIVNDEIEFPFIDKISTKSTQVETEEGIKVGMKLSDVRKKVDKLSVVSQSIPNIIESDDYLIFINRYSRKEDLKLTNLILVSTEFEMNNTKDTIVKEIILRYMF